MPSASYSLRALCVKGFLPLLCVGVFGLSLGASISRGAELEDLLSSGKLDEAQKQLEAALAEADDPLLATQLGAVQFLQAVEKLGQDSFRYGTGSRARMIPFFRLPVPINPNPEEVTYEDVRQMLEEFHAGLQRAEQTLAKVGDRPVKWSADMASIRLDLDGDGQPTPEESLGRVFLAITRGGRGNVPEGGFLVGVDTADVYWLRGYCNALSALADIALAYDQQRMFDHTAQLVFAKPELQYEFLTNGPEERWEWNIVDAIAMVHLLDWPLTAPERMAASREHLLAMVELSRKCWDQAEAETDNDREWIPNAQQTSVAPNAAMDEARIAAWRTFLDEAEALLEGEKLAPFWRKSSRGVNLKRVFTEPRDLDLVLWVQGTAAGPYLEEGEITQPETWQELQRVFRGQFVGFAFWLN